MTRGTIKIDGFESNVGWRAAVIRLVVQLEPADSSTGETFPLIPTGGGCVTPAKPSDHLTRTNPSYDGLQVYPLRQ